MRFSNSLWIERTQAPYDLTRMQTWTEYREPEDLSYVKDTGSVLLTGHRLGWNTRGDLVWRERVHDEDANEWGEVYRYDEMGRLTDCWTNVQTPSSYTTTDPTTGGGASTTTTSTTRSARCTSGRRSR